MDLSPVGILYKNLGMQAEVNEISKKETILEEIVHCRFKMRIH